jgi:hypothetical protein
MSPSKAAEQRFWIGVCVPEGWKRRRRETRWRTTNKTTGSAIPVGATWSSSLPSEIGDLLLLFAIHCGVLPETKELRTSPLR